MKAALVHGSGHALFFDSRLSDVLSFDWLDRPVDTLTFQWWVKPEDLELKQKRSVMLSVNAFNVSSDYASPYEIFISTSLLTGFYMAKSLATTFGPCTSACMPLSSELASSAWSHWAVVWDGSSGNLTVYLNGSVVFADQSLAQDNTKPVVPNGLAYIGQSLVDFPLTFSPRAKLGAVVDEYQVWERVLTPSEIQQSMRQPLSADGVSLPSNPPPSGLLIYFTFDDIQKALSSGEVTNLADASRPGRLGRVDSVVQKIVYDRTQRPVAPTLPNFVKSEIPWNSGAEVWFYAAPVGRSDILGSGSSGNVSWLNLSGLLNFGFSSAPAATVDSVQVMLAEPSEGLFFWSTTCNEQGSWTSISIPFAGGACVLVSSSSQPGLLILKINSQKIVHWTKWNQRTISNRTVSGFESQNITFCLGTVDSGGVHPSVRVLTLPQRGTLFDSQDAQITSVPYSLVDPSGKLNFLGDPFTYGDLGTNFYATFEYDYSDATQSPGVVTLFVQHQNHPPLGVSIFVNASSNYTTNFSLGVTDEDVIDTTFVYRLLTPPRLGKVQESVTRFPVFVSSPDVSIAYAARVVNASSQFTFCPPSFGCEQPWRCNESACGFTDYHAVQILGPPDVYPTAGDVGGGWDPANNDFAVEFIEVELEKALVVKKISIYETFTPGAVYKVSFAQSEQGPWTVYWQRPGGAIRESVPYSPRDFSPTLCPFPELVRFARLDLVHNYVVSAIDAIMVTGYLQRPAGILEYPILDYTPTPGLHTWNQTTDVFQYQVSDCNAWSPDDQPAKVQINLQEPIATSSLRDSSVAQWVDLPISSGLGGLVNVDFQQLLQTVSPNAALVRVQAWGLEEQIGTAWEIVQATNESYLVWRPRSRFNTSTVPINLPCSVPISSTSTSPLSIDLPTAIKIRQTNLDGFDCPWQAWLFGSDGVVVRLGMRVKSSCSVSQGFVSIQSPVQMWTCVSCGQARQIFSSQGGQSNVNNSDLALKLLACPAKTATAVTWIIVLCWIASAYGFAASLTVVLVLLWQQSTRMFATSNTPWLLVVLPSVSFLVFTLVPLLLGVSDQSLRDMVELSPKTRLPVLSSAVFGTAVAGWLMPYTVEAVRVMASTKLRSLNQQILHLNKERKTEARDTVIDGQKRFLLNKLLENAMIARKWLSFTTSMVLLCSLVAVFVLALALTRTALVLFAFFVFAWVVNFASVCFVLVFARKEKSILSYYQGFAERVFFLVYSSILVAISGVILSSTATVSQGLDELLLWLIFAVFHYRHYLHTVINYIISNFSGHAAHELAEVLKSERGFNFLMAFAQSEFSTENLQCWKHIEHFRSHTTLENLQLFVQTFVAVDATIPVNVSSSLAQSVRDKCAQWSRGGGGGGGGGGSGDRSPLLVATPKSADSKQELWKVLEKGGVTSYCPESTPLDEFQRRLLQSLTDVGVTNTDELKSLTPDDLDMLFHDLQPFALKLCVKRALTRFTGSGLAISDIQHCLDDMQREIERLVRDDTYNRFLGSSLYQSFRKGDVAPDMSSLGMTQTSFHQHQLSNLDSSSRAGKAPVAVATVFQSSSSARPLPSQSPESDERELFNAHSSGTGSSSRFASMAQDSLSIPGFKLATVELEVLSHGTGSSTSIRETHERVKSVSSVATGASTEYQTRASEADSDSFGSGELYVN